MNLNQILLFFFLQNGIAEKAGSNDVGVLKRLCNQRGPFTTKSVMYEEMNHLNMPKAEQRACYPVDETVGVNNGAENLLWYFREDLLMNSGHVYWHVSHPQNLLNPQDPLEIDRRGEMFYFFHRMVIDRYNAERMANGLGLVQPIVYAEGAPIVQGYDPHMLEAPTDFRYPPRKDNERFENITDSVDLWHLILSDIEKRMLIGKDGTVYDLDTNEGIDLIGEAIEASINSVNDERYSRIGVHSQGHRNIGLLHEDIGESVGDDLVCAPIFNPSTAMRDPVFYLWHKLLDDIFLRHKRLLKPHHPSEGEFPLVWEGVNLTAFSVQSLKDTTRPSNNLRTFFQTLTVEIPLTKDIFFSNETYEYCMKRLNYDEFVFNLTIEKDLSVVSNLAFVRIFLAPRYTMEGLRFSLEEQMEFFFVLDSFVVELNEGTTVVLRNSSLSNLLAHWKLETWEENAPYDYFAECGCGWPSHLLLPIGTKEGMAFDMFVIVTDAMEDIPEDLPIEEPVCKMSSILCGVKDRKYPDKRPMGYPMDTRPFSVEEGNGVSRLVGSLEEYVGLVPNSLSAQVIVQHDESY